jgi:hypothetical protein
MTGSSPAQMSRKLLEGSVGGARAAREVSDITFHHDSLRGNLAAFMALCMDLISKERDWKDVVHKPYQREASAPTSVNFSTSRVVGRPWKPSKTSNYRWKTHCDSGVLLKWTLFAGPPWVESAALLGPATGWTAIVRAS